LDEYNAGLEEGSDAWYDDNARRAAITSAMEAGGHTAEAIEDALASLGLKEGGIVGLRNGGPIREKYGIGGNISKNPTNTPYDSRASITDMAKAIQSSSAGTDNQKLRMLMDYNMSVNPDVTPKNVMFDQANMEKLLGLQPNPNFNYMKPSGPAMIMPAMASTGFRQDPGYFGNEGIMINGKRYMSEDEAIEDMGVETYNRFMADGGRVGRAGGGMMTVLPRGAEMDYRSGGMIPMGSKERADDVPARLSKNEFVMTADAVRAAGGGSVNKGAKRMYDLMHNLEARV
jgi:hypothetical protein